MDRLRLLGLSVAAFAVVAAGPAARAQYRLDASYCADLQSQYQDAVQRANSAGITDQSMAQIDQLSQQLAQAQSASQYYHCTGGFLFFGPRPGPQCPAIMAQVDRLGRQLRQLRGNGFFFGSSPAADVARLRDALDRNGCSLPQAASGGNRALCVRLCDGYYFPIEFDAPASRYDADAAACQSMYAKDGQAELFLQSRTDDVADATSLNGQRYADQPYAFFYRQHYVPACVEQLQSGIAALGKRYYSQFPPSPKVAALSPVAHAPLPVPQPRRPASEDPETLANAAGHFTSKPVAPRVALGDSGSPHVRLVGPAYYADMYNLSKVLKKQQTHHPDFSLITPAAAAEETMPNDPAATPPG